MSNSVVKKLFFVLILNQESIEVILIYAQIQLKYYYLYQFSLLKSSKEEEDDNNDLIYRRRIGSVFGQRRWSSDRKRKGHQ